jgi:manganese/iron transport system ATP-binding protein
MAQLLTRPPAHDDSAPSVQLIDATVRFNGVTALDGLTFSMPAGQLVAVVGPNGAGKTSLFKIIAGTLQPSSGSVEIFGHGPCGHVCIAYVPQRSQVDWKFPVTVTDVVFMGRIRKIGLFRWPSKQDKQIVRQALERVGMLKLGDRQIGELSGGQQQRVFLAQALAQEAEVVLLDEPLTGLDLPSQESIFSILNDLKQQSVTVMVATHDLNMATERFDQVLLLNRRLVAFGAPDEVFTRPHLLEAYGGSVHMVAGEDGVVVVADTCCEGDEEHGRYE